MRRAFALLLLVVFSFPLIAPAMFVDAQSSLPECCRRSGKHHCAMMLDDAPGSGVSFRAVQSRCPMFPGTPAAPPCVYAAILSNRIEIFGALVRHPAIHRQTEAGYRISFDRSSQKRGPPSLS